MIDSQSLVPVMQGTNTISHHAYSEVFGASVAADVGGRALRDSRYKLIRFNNGVDEFYDLQTDPYETSNLFPVMTTEQRAYHDRLRFRLNGYSTNTGALIASASWANNQFSCTLTQAAGYTLWRCDDVGAGFWSEATNAVLTTNGSVVTLKDLSPPNGRAFYSVVK
jgi:hypothetical protein